MLSPPLNAAALITLGTAETFLGAGGEYPYFFWAQAQAISDYTLYTCIVSVNGEAVEGTTRTEDSDTCTYTNTPEIYAYDEVEMLIEVINNTTDAPEQPLTLALPHTRESGDWSAQYWEPRSPWIVDQSSIPAADGLTECTSLPSNYLTYNREARLTRDLGVRPNANDCVARVVRLVPYFSGNYSLSFALYPSDPAYEENLEPIIDRSIDFEIGITRLDFAGEDRNLMAPIFLATFYETSMDQYSTGNLEDFWLRFNEGEEYDFVYHPNRDDDASGLMSAEDAIASLPDDVRSFVSDYLVADENFLGYAGPAFLLSGDYCNYSVPYPYNNAAMEQLGIIEIPRTNHVSEVFISHCNPSRNEIMQLNTALHNDHRYLYAAAALNGMLVETRTGNEPFRYFESFRSSLNSPSSDFWEPISRICDTWEEKPSVLVAYDTYENVYSPTSSRNNWQLIRDWMNGYVQCQIRRDDSEVQRLVWLQGYINIMRHIEYAVTDFETYPSYFSEYQLSSDIVLVPEYLYYDSSNGSYQSKHASLNGISYDTCVAPIIDNCSYNNFSSLTEIHVFNAYEVHISEVLGYAADWDTIVRPAIRMERDSQGNYGVVHWISFAFQQTGDIEIMREAVFPLPAECNLQGQARPPACQSNLRHYPR
jgi:hypothetical protein